MKAQNSARLAAITGDDGLYMRRLVKYLRTKINVDPDAVEDAVADLLEGAQAAQGAGKSAATYFGPDPKIAAKAILHQLPRRTGWQYFDLWWPWVSVFGLVFFANGMLNHYHLSWAVTDLFSLLYPLAVIVSNWLGRGLDYAHPTWRKWRIALTLLLCASVIVGLGVALDFRVIPLPWMLPVLFVSFMQTLNFVRLFRHWDSVWWLIFWPGLGIVAMLSGFKALIGWQVFLYALVAFIIVCWRAPLWRYHK